MAEAPKVDEFEASFNQISAAMNEAEAGGKTLSDGDVKTAPLVEKTAEQIAAETAAAETAAAEAAAAKAAEGKTPEQIAAEAEAAAATSAAEAAAAAAAAAKGDEDLIKRLANVIKSADPNADTARAAETARQAEADRAAQAEAERVRQQQNPQLSPEDLAAVQAAEKDFPDVFKASAIVRRAEYRQIVAHVFGEVEKAFNERVAPIAALVQNLAERTHVGDLKTVVPDYDKLDVGKLAEWVGKQPTYLRSGMDQVMKSGSAEDVKDLVTRFYTETGVKPPAATAPDPAVAAAAAAAAATAEAARKKAIAALAPTPAKRGDTAAPAAPTDFGGAFETWSKQLAEEEAGSRFTR